MDWKAAYLVNVSTKVMLPIFKQNAKPKWSDKQLHSIEVEYRSFLTENHVGMLHDKLVYYKPIFRDSRHIALIIVPKLLHC